MDSPAIVNAELADQPVPPGRPCEKCGAPIEPGDHFCNGCGQIQETEPVEAELVQKFFRCQSCGAEVAMDANSRSYVCPFCDSTYVVDFSPAESGRQPPEFVIGFAIAPEQAARRFHQWLRENTWFRPGDLRLAQLEGKLRGVYLPFWSFSMQAESVWRAEIGEYWYRTESYTVTVNGKTERRTRQVRETEWWNLSGRHHDYYSGYLIAGSRGLGQQESQRILPYRLEALKRYQPYFLAGWLSEEYSIDRETALAQCREEFNRRVQADVAAFLPGDTYRELRVGTEYAQIGSDLILLPVYLASYRYRNKLYRFMLNGQTGRIAGDKPLSRRRIGAAVGGAVGLVVLILLLLWLLGVFGR